MFSIENRIIRLPEIDSTNTYALHLLKAGAKNGTVILADRQTNGHGRLGRQFFSPGNVGIYMTYIYAVPADSACLNLLTSVAGLCVAEAIEQTACVPCSIKWPNDILIEDKKVCGILTKLVTNPDNNKVAYALIGIGVNVNHKPEDFPEDLRQKASSIRFFAKQQINKDSLAIKIIENLNNNLYCYEKKRDVYLDQIKQRSYTLGKRVYITTQDKYYHAVDLSEDGGLVVSDAGIRRVIHSGEAETI